MINSKKNGKTVNKKKKNTKNVSGYGVGSVEVVMSVDQVAKEAASISKNAPNLTTLDLLANNESFLSITNLIVLLD